MFKKQTYTNFFISKIKRKKILLILIKVNVIFSIKKKVSHFTTVFEKFEFHNLVWDV
jgi:hypothetical protein